MAGLAPLGAGPLPPVGLARAEAPAVRAELAGLDDLFTVNLVRSRSGIPPPADPGAAHRPWPASGPWTSSWPPRKRLVVRGLLSCDYGGRGAAMWAPRQGGGRGPDG